MLEQQALRRELDKLIPDIRKQVVAAKLRDDLVGSVEELLAGQPALSWDLALAEIIEDDTSTEDEPENPPDAPAPERNLERLQRLRREGKID